MSQSFIFRCAEQVHLKSVDIQNTNQNLANKHTEIAQIFEFMLILTELFEIVI